MKNIKFLSMFALLTVGALFLTNCTPGDEPEPKPVLSFLGGSEYVDEDISLSAYSDFTMAITASHSSNIKQLTVTQSLNGNPEIALVDSSFSDKTITMFEYNGTTGENKGTETYTFTVSDKNGNSTSKSITITNLGNAGLSLLTFETDNDGNPFRVYNFRGSELGAYGILSGGPLGIDDPASDKDIQDSTTLAETSTWPARWTSRNGTSFRKVTANSWSSISNDSEILAGWDAAGGSTSFVNITEGDLYILNLKNSDVFALVEITKVNSTPSNNLDYVQFRYKRQQ